MSQARVRITMTHLSDGRELFYFDDSERFVSGKETRELHDSRTLPEIASNCFVRQDPLTGNWISYAAHRMDRTFLPAADDNPLAPSKPGKEPTEIPADAYDVVVFENRFPSFEHDAYRDGSLPDHVDNNDIFPQIPGRGRCEVVCFTSDPDTSFAELPDRRVRTVIEAWAERTAALSAIEGIKQVFCFENRGKEIGVTLQHPHGQIYGYPFLPPRTQSIMYRAKAYQEVTGNSLLRDVMNAELLAQKRVIQETDEWVAWVPEAAQWPMELMLAPKKDAADFSELDDKQRADLAWFYPSLLRRVDQFFPGVDRTAYIASWNQAPIGEFRQFGRLYLQLFSIRRSPNKLKFLAGSESGMGAWISDTTPERIAQRFHELSDDQEATVL